MGNSVRLSDLKKGDKLSATVITHGAPIVLTEKEVQAVLDEPAAAAPAPTQRWRRLHAGGASRRRRHRRRPPPRHSAESGAEPPAEQSSGLGLMWWVVIAVIIALVVFFARR